MIKYMPLMLILASLSVVGVSAKQETCPQDFPWHKTDSADLTDYPVASASAYCFKAGQYLLDEMPKNGFGQDGPCSEADPHQCDLSHWSWKQATTSASPSPSPTSSPSAKPSPSVLPSPSPSPTVKPSPSPSPTPKPKSDVEKAEESVEGLDKSFEEQIEMVEPTTLGVK